jgi:ABC-type multidrug transport system ATPase subunit
MSVSEQRGSEMGVEPRRCGRPEARAGGPPVLVARGLTRRFGDVEALAGADISIAPGESVAVLGPNGAGKTTLLGIVAGVTARNEGTLTWAPGAAPRVGWVPERPALYQRLTARENLRLFATLEGAPDPRGTAESLLARADLLHFADRRAATLSTGTLQRLNLAIALAGRPALLVLDEPSAKLSPDQRARLWAWLTELRDVDGLAVLFSCQHLEEAAAHADRTIVLVAGRTVFGGTVADLVAWSEGDPDAPDAPERAFLALVQAAMAGRDLTGGPGAPVGAAR